MTPKEFLEATIETMDTVKLACTQKDLEQSRNLVTEFVLVVTDYQEYTALALMHALMVCFVAAGTTFMEKQKDPTVN